MLTVDARHWFCRASLWSQRLHLKEWYLAWLMGARGTERYENYPVFYRCNAPAAVEKYGRSFSEVCCFNLCVGQCDEAVPRFLQPLSRRLESRAIQRGKPGTLLVVRAQTTWPPRGSLRVLVRCHRDRGVCNEFAVLLGNPLVQDDAARDFVGQPNLVFGLKTLFLFRARVSHAGQLLAQHVEGVLSNLGFNAVQPRHKVRLFDFRWIDLFRRSSFDGAEEIAIRNDELDHDVLGRHGEQLAGDLFLLDPIGDHFLVRPREDGLFQVVTVDPTLQLDQYL